MRKRPTEIPYLLAFYPSLRVASDRTLSVYFPVRAQGYQASFYEFEFKRLVEAYRHRLSDDDREVVDRELPRVLARLAVVRPAGCPSMAAFSDESKRVLDLLRLPEETESRLEVGPPLLAPIDLLLKRYSPALVVIVDKEKVQTFAFVLDDVIPQHRLEGAPVKHIRSGGTKNPSLQRKEENRVKANLSAAVRLIDREVSAVSYRRLFIAGPEEARAEIERLLPPSLKKIVAGHLHATFEGSSGELEVQLRKQLVHTP